MILRYRCGSITLLFSVAVMRYSCGTWKVTSVRNWSELSQYQIELLNERVYFSHCKDLDQVNYPVCPLTIRVCCKLPSVSTYH